MTAGRGWRTRAAGEGSGGRRSSRGGRYDGWARLADEGGRDRWDGEVVGRGGRGGWKEEVLAMFLVPSGKRVSRKIFWRLYVKQNVHVHVVLSLSLYNKIKSFIF